MLVEYLKKYFQKIFSSHKNCTENYPQINLPDALLSSVRVVYDNMKISLLLISVFATIITVAAFIFNNSIICNLPTNMQKVFTCATPLGIMSIMFFIIKIFVISMFIRLWYNSAINKQNITVYKIFMPTVTDIKIFLALLVVLAINLLPLVSFLLIQARVPNPDWIIETVYFACVSTGFVIPLLMFFYYMLIVFIIKKQKFPSFNTINKYIFSNSNKIFFSSLFYIFVSVFLVTFYSLKTIPYISYNVLINTICGEFIYNALVLTFILFFVNYLINIQECLFETNKNQLQ